MMKIYWKVYGGKPMADLTSFDRTVIATIDRYGLWTTGSRILVACSGGSDSLALLWWLVAQRSRYALTVGAVYVHHHLRAAATAEAAYVEEIGAAQGIPVYIRHADVPRRIADTGESTETAARVLRYRCLTETAAAEGYDRIAVAHHADDQAETVLHHLLRGSGPRGLRGMLPRTGDIVRPFLDVTRAEIETYLSASCPYVPCTDETNTDTRYLRNALRHDVLPYLRRYNPRISDSFVRLSHIMRDETAWADEMTAAWWQAQATVTEEYTSLPRPMVWATALGRHIVRHAYARYARTTPDWSQTETILSLWKSGRTGAIYAARGLYWEVAADALRIYRERPVTDMHAASAAAGEAAELVLGAVRVPVRQSPTPDGIVNVPISILHGALRLRYRRPGDRITVRGVGTQKWKDWLINHKVPRSDRDGIVLLADEERIYHAFGYWQGERQPNEPGPYWAIGDRRRKQDERTD